MSNAAARALFLQQMRSGVYFPSGRFSLWGRRHTDEWVVVDDDLTLPQCFDRLKSEPWFER